ncbi:G1 family glutamic endopeptidase [Actinoallomurus iriomotensis]|uniref:Secreted protein n=1 Tax=Actinoallomurus iriomotensis TaxID=478107 RepID=A0A9W6VTH6_9ACTN|nr:G1 family glutamic endopeptidase [Actinoallomurus iriomotensis]GLY79745.1 hypothetical protein Airi01_080120 [Actinoallomurus iriomotensis]
MLVKRLSVLPATIVVSLLLSTPAFGAIKVSDANGDKTVASLRDCQKYPVEETYSIDSAGRRSVAADDTGKVRVFGKGGNTMKVAVPPADFDPHTATDAQLRMYGFPPRPKSGPARTRWDALYPHHQIDFVLPEMCSDPHVTHRPPQRTKSALAPDPLTSDNWSGGIAVNPPDEPPFTSAFVRWQEPSFNAVCPTASGYSIWSGIGGWDTGDRPVWGLLQAGVDNIGGSGPNDAYAFWEALNQNKDQTLPEQHIVNMKVSALDQVQSMTYYNPIDKTVSFQIYNLTTNKLATLGPWSTIVDPIGSVKGFASDYYDGWTGELIAERPSVDDAYINLRQPQTGYSQFLDAELGYDSDGDPFPGYEYVGWQPIKMTSDKDLSVPTGFPTSGATMWQNTWKACS